MTDVGDSVDLHLYVRGSINSTHWKKFAPRERNVQKDYTHAQCPLRVDRLSEYTKTLYKVTIREKICYTTKRLLLM